MLNDEIKQAADEAFGDVKKTLQDEMDELLKTLTYRDIVLMEPEKQILAYGRFFLTNHTKLSKRRSCEILDQKSK